MAEPRVPNAPQRVWRDIALVAIFVPAAVLEMILREAAGWKPGALAITLVLAGAMLWRRTHPLAAMATAFGSIAVMDLVSHLVADQPLEFYSAAVVLVIPYALFRWGSGKEAVIGFFLMIAIWVFGNAMNWSGIGDAIGGFVVLMFPAALGDIVRLQKRSRSMAMEEVKLREREQLARELHDTVAHHVSAIAIQAQAGRAVAATEPEAALGILTTIEEEASRTLVEMRTMVSALRAGDEADLAPQAAFDDIERLASASTGLPVRFERTGDLVDLDPAIDRTLYRLAQESITNATRHARYATEVKVSVHGYPDHIRLTVSDDGDARPFDSTETGFGLVGMRERAHLLGGTLHAGPLQGRGWSVDAVLPREPHPTNGAMS